MADWLIGSMASTTALATIATVTSSQQVAACSCWLVLLRSRIVLIDVICWFVLVEGERANGRELENLQAEWWRVSLRLVEYQ